MRKANVVLSFDDGRRDNICIAKEILLPLNISATFNITTGYIDGSCSKSILETLQDPMTTDDIRWLHNQQIFEIALHGDKHLNTEEDISVSRKKLINWLGLKEDYVFGFASPNCRLDIAQVNQSNSELFNTKILYFRVGPNHDNKYGKFILKLLYYVDRFFKNTRFEKIYSKYVLYYTNLGCYIKKPKRIIYSVPVYRYTTVDELKILIEKCAKKRATIVLMFHSVLDEDENEILSNSGDRDYNWGKSEFLDLCGYLQEMKDLKKIEVVTTKQLVESHING